MHSVTTKVQALTSSVSDEENRMARIPYERAPKRLLILRPVAI